MSIQYREISEEEYARRLRMVISSSEGLHARAQNVGDNKATIGWGYTFNRNNNEQIWRDSGISLTEAEWTMLRNIDRAADSEKTSLGLRFSRVLNEAEADKLLRATIEKGYSAPANLLNMPLSDERIAMISLAYNRGPERLLGSETTPEHPVMDAIRRGDRAEAWFQMRYNCWGNKSDSEAGLRKRRFAEAEVFGLYNDKEQITPDEARSVYRMLQLHRDEIERVEARFGESLDGSNGRRNMIQQANRDYPMIVREYGRVSTISESLAPARTVLLADIEKQHPGTLDASLLEGIQAGRIYLDPGRDLNDRNEINARYAGSNRLKREHGNATVQDVQPEHEATLDSRRQNARGAELESDDLLLGEGGNDTLRAHKGHDVLIGGEGHNRMEGGQGRDVYFARAGDTIHDSDQQGEIYLGGQKLTGGESIGAHTYRSEDGRFAYELHGRNLHVIDNHAPSSERKPLVIENFDNGRMGISLSNLREIRPEENPQSEREKQARAIVEPAASEMSSLSQLAQRVLNSSRTELDQMGRDIANSPLGEQFRQRGAELWEERQAELRRQEQEAQEWARQQEQEKAQQHTPRGPVMR
ncbi:hypothetical protein ABFV80_002065 [Vandammella animalimorsus]|uniref:glycoside hydrolase family protein n=1 Tax=Vandammella animalimorsus TaxID=2029117 RepID=UPI00325B9363